MRLGNAKHVLHDHFVLTRQIGYTSWMIDALNNSAKDKNIIFIVDSRENAKLIEKQISNQSVTVLSVHDIDSIVFMGYKSDPIILFDNSIIPDLLKSNSSIFWNGNQSRVVTMSGICTATDSTANLNGDILTGPSHFEEVIDTQIEIETNKEIDDTIKTL